MTPKKTGRWLDGVTCHVEGVAMEGLYLPTGFLGRSFGWTFPNIIFCTCLAEPRQRARCFRMSFRNGMRSSGRFFFGITSFLRSLGVTKFWQLSILVTFSYHQFLVTFHTYVHRFFTPPPLSQEDVAPQGSSRHSQSETPLFHYVDRTKEKPARWWSRWAEKVPVLAWISFRDWNIRLILLFVLLSLLIKQEYPSSCWSIKFIVFKSPFRVFKSIHVDPPRLP